MLWGGLRRGGRGEAGGGRRGWPGGAGGRGGGRGRRLKIANCPLLTQRDRSEVSPKSGPTKFVIGLHGGVFRPSAAVLHLNRPENNHGGSGLGRFRGRSIAVNTNRRIAKFGNTLQVAFIAVNLHPNWPKPDPPWLFSGWLGCRRAVGGQKPPR